MNCFAHQIVKTTKTDIKVLWTIKIERKYSYSIPKLINYFLKYFFRYYIINIFENHKLVEIYLKCTSVGYTEKEK